MMIRPELTGGSKAYRAMSAALLIALFLAGMLHWMFFFSNPRGEGLAACIGGDWSLGAIYHNVIRDALRQGEIPYFMSYKGHFSDRFLGLPETPLAPQYLLLPFLSDAQFNLFNVLLLFSCSFVGLLLLKREMGLSTLPFVLLFLIYNFNGYLVSRVSTGHFMWFGYFFLPLLQLCLIRLLQQRDVHRNEILFGAVFLLIMLHGSLHLSVWLVMYLGFVAILQPRSALSVLRALAWSFALCFFRLLPGALTLWDTRYKIVDGYRGLPQFLEALTELHGVAYNDIPRFGDLCWWEVDCFIGLSGCLLLAYFGVIRALAQSGLDAPGNDLPSSSKRLYALDGAALLILPFCFGGLMHTLGELPLPIFRSQRIPTRMIIVPLLMCTLMAACRLNDFLKTRREGPFPFILVAGLLCVLAYELYLHACAWRVFYMDELFQGVAHYQCPDGGQVVNMPDPPAPGARAYVWSVWLGAAVSMASALLGVLMFRRGACASSAVSP